MVVDWGQAVQIGGIGFSTVFAVLIILAAVIWLTGLVLSKFSTAKDKTTNSKKGA